MRQKAAEVVFDVFNSLFLVVIALIMFYPVLYVIFASLSNGTELVMHRGLLLKPLSLSFAGYETAFKYKMLLTGYKNTIFIVVVGGVINLLLTSFGAYALSRKSLRFKRTLSLFILFTMYFNGGLIPYFLVVKNVGLIDSIWSLIIPVSINTFYLMIMRTSFESIPHSLEESAKIDGANDFTILFRIILPVSKSVIAVMILYYSVGHWNAWFNAILFLRERKLYPLQLVLREILLLYETNSMTGALSDPVYADVSETLKYAVIVVATIPILLIYPFLQRYFIKGVMIGAIKE